MEIQLDLPAVFEDLMEHLGAAGFALDEVRYSPGSFGDAIVQMHRKQLRIRFVRDRGHWDVVLRSPKKEAWYEIAVWEAAIKGATGKGQPAPDVALQSSLLRELLSDIEDASRDSSLDSRLERIGAERARGYLQTDSGG